MRICELGSRKQRDYTSLIDKWNRAHKRQEARHKIVASPGPLLDPPLHSLPALAVALPLHSFAPKRPRLTQSRAAHAAKLVRGGRVEFASRRARPATLLIGSRQTGGQFPSARPLERLISFV